MTKQEHCNKRPIAYHSSFGGIEIHEVDSAEERVYFVAQAWSRDRKYHTSKIYYNQHGNPYFVFAGIRIYLCECLKF